MNGNAPDREPVRAAPTARRTGRDNFGDPMDTRIPTPLPSNRTFGWTFSVLFAACGLYGLWCGGVLAWVGVLALLTAAVTLTRPVWLAPLNRAWMKLGGALHRVVSPVVLGLLYFGMFTTIGWAMRAIGHDAMKRSFDPAARTYWIDRVPPGPAEDSFRDLF